MAFPAYRSSSTINTQTSGSSFVLTKPAGLAVGDYMLVGLRYYDTTSGSITAPAGWNTLYSDGTTQHAARYFDKIADASDVAASDFTFPITTAVDARVGYIAAFSGAASRQDYDLRQFDSGAVSGSVSVTPLTNESLVLTTLTTLDFELSAALTSSASTITPSTTLTERVDVGNRDGANDGISAFLYSGENTGTSEITAFSFTTSESVAIDNHGGVIILNGVQDADANISGQSLSVTIKNLVGSNTANATVSSVDLSIDVKSVGSKSSSDATQWNNKAKGDDQWTNKDK
jgi:hypothetical protein